MKTAYLIVLNGGGDTEVKLVDKEVWDLDQQPIHWSEERVRRCTEINTGVRRQTLKRRM